MWSPHGPQPPGPDSGEQRVAHHWPAPRVAPRPSAESAGYAARIRARAQHPAWGARRRIGSDSRVATTGRPATIAPPTIMLAGQSRDAAATSMGASPRRPHLTVAARCRKVDRLDETSPSSPCPAGFSRGRRLVLDTLARRRRWAEGGPDRRTTLREEPPQRSAHQPRPPGPRAAAGVGQAVERYSSRRRSSAGTGESAAS